MNRTEADLALRLWDDQVDAADACAEANARLPAPVVIDPSKPPIRGG